MKKIIKISSFIVFLPVAVVALAWLISLLVIRVNGGLMERDLAAPLSRGADYRDLNKNGRKDIYETADAPIEDRVEDLLKQMTLEEKAGLMFIDMIPAGQDGSLVEGYDPRNEISLLTPSTRAVLLGKHMNSFNIVYAPEHVANWVQWANAIQALAERTRLGIPVTLASDPRHSSADNPFAKISTPFFSQWPEPIGLAAAGDPQLVQRFADIARQEYRAVGLQLALHPMADLATEPRWPRISGTFGEDAHLAASLVKAYVQGLQGPELGPTSVAAMVKHFAGGGAQKDGGEPHFASGKEQAFPGNNFAYHQIPFVDGAFAAGAAQVMPHYGIAVGQTDENVGNAFNRAIITGLLRNKFGFKGVVCTDWSVVSDTKVLGLFTLLPARAWGVENLDSLARVEKLLNAGIDMLGGERSPQWIVDLVRSGRISEARIDDSARRILRDKFRLGLFDNPYVDLEKAIATVGKHEFVAAGVDAQRRSMVLLKASPATWPLKRGIKVYAEHINPALLTGYARVVNTPEEADVALIRTASPYEPSSGIFANIFRGGALDFKGEQRQHLLDIMQRVPTVIDVYLDRPAVMPELAKNSQTLVASFGVDDKVFLDLAFGVYKASGKLPFELPSSMDAVLSQKEDVPYDSRDPLFPFGFGLTY